MNPCDERRDDVPGYLHDPQAVPDPEIVRLEEALAPLRFGGGAPDELVLAARPTESVAGRRGRRAAAAIAMVAALLTIWLVWPDDALRPGGASRSFVTAASARTIALGELATIELQPNSEFEFLQWRAGQEARFRLVRGSLSASVLPPPRVQPGFFVIETPRAIVVDQGCRYELVVDAGGAARVFVQEGAVTFGDGDRQVFVPAGARARLIENGVGTPTFLTASQQVRKLVELSDGLRGGKDAQRYVDSVRKLASVCREGNDTLPLYHFLLDDDPTVAKVAQGALLDLVGPPGGEARKGPIAAAEWLDFLRVSVWQAGG